MILVDKRLHVDIIGIRQIPCGNHGNLVARGYLHTCKIELIVFGKQEHLDSWYFVHAYKQIARVHH